MGFCSQCGRPIEGNLSFCPSCGAAYSPSTLAPTPAAPGFAATGGGRGPPGEVRSPGIVLLLILVTLGIYGLFFWLRAARETDAYTQRPDHARGKVRLGFLLSLGALVVFILGFVLAGASLPMSEAEAQAQDVSGGAVAGFLLAMFVGVALTVAGTVFLFIGQWRVWSAIQDDESRRGVPTPLSPGLMLAFMLIPYVNIVTMWIAYYKTQKGLNGMWESATAAPVAAPLTL